MSLKSKSVQKYYTILKFYLRILQICAETHVEKGKDGPIQPLNLLHERCSIHSDGEVHFSKIMLN